MSLFCYHEFYKYTFSWLISLVPSVSVFTFFFFLSPSKISYSLLQQFAGWVLVWGCDWNHTMVRDLFYILDLPCKRYKNSLYQWLPKHSNIIYIEGKVQELLLLLFLKFIITGFFIEAMVLKTGCNTWSRLTISEWSYIFDDWHFFILSCEPYVTLCWLSLEKISAT